MERGKKSPRYDNCLCYRLLKMIFFVVVCICRLLQRKRCSYKESYLLFCGALAKTVNNIYLEKQLCLIKIPGRTRLMFLPSAPFIKERDLLLESAQHGVSSFGLSCCGWNVAERSLTDAGMTIFRRLKL